MVTADLLKWYSFYLWQKQAKKVVSSGSFLGSGASVPMLSSETAVTRRALPSRWAPLSCLLYLLFSFFWHPTLCFSLPTDNEIISVGFTPVSLSGQQIVNVRHAMAINRKSPSTRESKRENNLKDIIKKTWKKGRRMTECSRPSFLRREWDREAVLGNVSIFVPSGQQPNDWNLCL